MPLARPELGDEEISAVVETLRSGQLCQGEVTERFERAFADEIGAEHAVAVTSGSTALLVAMQAMGIGPGDEVIVPDITFATTATAAVYLGAKPVFCDIHLDDFCLDIHRCADLINERTKLVVPVHLGGAVVDVDSLRQLLADRNIQILEDAAGAHLASRDGRMAGTLGDAAIFSFTPTKPITTGEGGVITTNNATLAKRCRLIRNFGDEGKFAWESLGFNFRMTAMSAAIGIEQVKRLQANVERRREIAAKYYKAFARAEAITLPNYAAGQRTNYQLYPILLDTEKLGMTRDEVIDQLAARGVAARLYYPAMHRMGVFAPFGPFDDEQFPVACRYAAASLCLPVYVGMTGEQQQHVIQSVQEVTTEAAKQTA